MRKYFQAHLKEALGMLDTLDGTAPTLAPETLKPLEPVEVEK
jgi:hypothetical protein